MVMVSIDAFDSSIFVLRYELDKKKGEEAFFS